MQDKQAVDKEIELVVSDEGLDQHSSNKDEVDCAATPNSSEHASETAAPTPSSNHKITAPTVTSATATSYECEYLSLRIHDALEKCMKHGKAKEADLLSRLLLDVNESLCDGNEAIRILDMIESQLPQQPAAFTSSPGSTTQKKLLIFSLSFVLTFLCGVFVLRVMTAVQPHSKPPALAKAGVTSSPYQFFTTPPEGKPELLISHSSTVQSNFRLVNSTNKRISVYWLDYGGDRVHYFDLQPGARQTQQTYSSHPWVIVDETDKALLWFVAGTNRQIEIDLGKMLNVIFSGPQKLKKTH